MIIEKETYEFQKFRAYSKATGGPAYVRMILPDAAVDARSQVEQTAVLGARINCPERADTAVPAVQLLLR